MEPNTPHIQSLLQLLHSWYPLSKSFRTHIEGAMQQQAVKPKQQLFHYGAHVFSAWYSVDCWISQHHMLDSGLEEIIHFFRPGEIFTDLPSFLRGETTRSRAGIIEGSTLLSISRQQFSQLKPYPETAELLLEYMLQQEQKDLWRISMLALHEKEKVAMFAKSYPINHLPGNLCASFLRMSASHFSLAKNSYNRNH